MASFDIPVSDKKLLEILQKQHGLVLGDSHVDEESIRVRRVPPTAGNPTTHQISVTLDFDLTGPEVKAIVDL